MFPTKGQDDNTFSKASESSGNTFGVSQQGNIFSNPSFKANPEQPAFGQSFGAASVSQIHPPKTTSNVWGTSQSTEKKSFGHFAAKRDTKNFFGSPHAFSSQSKPFNVFQQQGVDESQVQPQSFTTTAQSMFPTTKASFAFSGKTLLSKPIEKTRFGQVEQVQSRKPTFHTQTQEAQRIHSGFPRNPFSSQETALPTKDQDYKLRRKRSLEGEAGGESPIKSHPKITREFSKQSTLRREGINPSKRLFQKALGVAKQGTQEIKQEPFSSQPQLMAKAKEVTPVRRMSSSNAFSPPDTVNMAKLSTSLTVTQVPARFNNKEDLKRRFSRFGIVKRVFPNPKQSSAVVHYEKPEEAFQAKQKGKKIFGPGNEIRIYFRKSRGQSIDKKEAEEIKKDDQLGEDNVFSKPLTQQRKPVAKKTRAVPFQAKPTTMSKTIVARTNKEKLQVLERIDKALRSKTVKQSDLSKATLVKGTCPDMCPEKERYLRTERNLLASYEMTEDRTVDHTKAVKEYSRSSADQEEALAHELRPSSVLRITMDYLILNVMNRIDHENVADWYDFLWNRTRAIRKEISIQQLNDSVAVQVAEECARFHICCGHELCEMDRMCFDPKINNENLEKAMKTVLDMYTEVRLQSGQELENESEFLAYHVLLNINKSSDVLRELQTMSAEVRASENVRLAVAVFSSVHINNYARFFGLLARATYLQGVIMHRYFAQVRKQACHTMARAYSTKANAVIPAVDLVRLLHFNHLGELETFCSEHAIPLESGCLKLGRAETLESDGSVTVHCSEELSMKLNGRHLGQIVAHGRAPSSEIHQPTTSFDEEGRYIGPYANLLSSQDADPQAPVTKPAGEQATSSSEPNVSEALRMRGITPQAIKLATVKLIREVLDEDVPAICKEFVALADQVVASTKVCDDVTDDVIEEEVRKIVHTRIVEERLEEEQRIAREEAAARKRAEEARRLQIAKEREAERQRIVASESVVVNQSIHEQVVAEVVASVATFVHREARLDALALQTRDDLADLVTTEETERIAREVMKEERNRKHSEIEKRMLTRRSVIRFLRWRRALLGVLNRRQAERNFPGAPRQRSLRDQVSALLPLGCGAAEERAGKRRSFPIGRSERCRLSLEPIGSLIETQQRCQLELSASVRQDAERKKLALASTLPLCDIYYDAYVETRSEGSIDAAGISTPRWKLGLACSSDAASESITAQWLRKKIGCHETEFSVSSKVYETTDARHHVSVCSRFLKDYTRSALLGLRALVFLVTDDGENPDWKQMRAAQSNLEKLLSSKPSYPPFPLLILMEKALHYEYCHADLGVEQLQEASLISSWKLLVLEDRFSFVRNDAKLEDGIRFLARSSPDPVHLRSGTMRDLLEDHVSRHYIAPLYRHHALRRTARLPPLDPSSIIEIYNGVLMSFADVITSADLLNVSWPQMEHLKPDDNALSAEWNTENRFKFLSSIVQRIALPSFSTIETSATIEETFLEITRYCREACPFSPTLASSVRATFQSSVREYSTRFAEEQYTFAELLPWQNVVDAVASSLFEHVLYGTAEGNLVVAYDPVSMNEVAIPEQYETLFAEVEFQAADLELSERSLSKDVDLSETIHSQYSGAARNLDNILARSRRAAVTNNRSLVETDETSQAKNDAIELNEMIKKEMSESERFENRLKEILADDSTAFTFEYGDLSSLFS